MFYLCLLFVSNIFFEIGFVSTCGSDLSNVLLDNKYEFIDLTLPLDKSREDESKRIEDVAVPTSRGTHIEAPFNKDHDDVSVTDLPTEKLIVQLIVIDVSAKVHSDSKYVLNTKDLNTSLSSDIIYHMRSKPSFVVFTFGWSQYYFKDSLGYEKATDSINLPAISYDVAKWLTSCESCKNVVGVGTDLPSINERAHNMSMPTRKTLIKAGFYVIEGLKWNHSLSNYQCIAIVSPMKIKEPQAPANVIAICPKDDDINGAEDKKEYKREKREHKHHNMREQMMAIQNNNGHHHHQLSNTTELKESKIKNEKHHTMCKQIMEVGDGMCGHNHQLSKVDEAHTNTLELTGTNNDKVDIQGQDKNKTSLVNETRPHQIDEIKNNIKDNNNQIKTNSHIEITKNVTQGNNKVNSASKKPVKTGEMEKKQPDLTSAPHNIIVGISNIKDKIKDFVIP